MNPYGTQVDDTHISEDEAASVPDGFRFVPDVEPPARFKEPVLSVGVAGNLALVPGLIALGLTPLEAVAVVCFITALDLVKRALVRPNQ